MGAGFAGAFVAGAFVAGAFFTECDSALLKYKFSLGRGERYREERYRGESIEGRRHTNNRLKHQSKRQWTQRT